jgi:hypothetical protein
VNGEGTGEPRRRRPTFADEALDWLRALGLGLRDTATDILDAGRKSARDTTDQYWGRFEGKTRRRREAKARAKSKR